MTGQMKAWMNEGMKQWMAGNLHIMCFLMSYDNIIILSTHLRGEVDLSCCELTHLIAVCKWEQLQSF